VIAIRPASPSNSLAIALKSSASPGVFKSANTATLTVPRHVLAVRGSADLARSIVAGEYRHTSDIVKFDVVSSLAFASSRVRLHLRRPRAALAAVAATTIHAQCATRHRARASRVAARRRFPPPLVMARRALDYVTLETRDVAVSVRVAAPTPY
jgi:hypothetical protein